MNTLAECFVAGTGLVPIHAAADIIIFVSCCALSMAVLLYIRSKQPEFKIGCYAAAGVIFWIGLLYLGSFLSLWYPIFFAVGIMKAVTAAGLLVTAIAAFPLLPRALEILTPQEYESVIRKLYDSNKTMETEVQKATEESNKLAKELTRRVRHVLATVHGISKETARSTPDIATYLKKFNSRIIGLTHSNNLLQSNNWRGADLKDVIRAQLEQFAGLVKRVKVDGPSIYLRTSAVQHLSLAIHELAANTNGSSTPTITWQRHENDPNRDNNTFTLLWEESVPKGSPEPTHRGFGHVVLNYTVPTSLNGLSELRFNDENIQWELEVPMTSLC